MVICFVCLFVYCTCGTKVNGIPMVSVVAGVWNDPAPENWLKQMRFCATLSGVTAQVLACWAVLSTAFQSGNSTWAVAIFKSMCFRFVLGVWLVFDILQAGTKGDAMADWHCFFAQRGTLFYDITIIVLLCNFWNASGLNHAPTSLKIATGLHVCLLKV